MFGGYAYTYAVKGDVAMTSDQAAYLTSFYWVCCVVAVAVLFLFVKDCYFISQFRLQILDKRIID